MKKPDLARPYIQAAFHKNRLTFIALMVSVIINGILNAGIALLLQLTTDTATGTGRFTVMELVILTALFIAVFLINNLIERELRSRYQRRANAQYKQKIFQELAKKNIASFSRERTSTYISMLTADATKIEETYFENAVSILQYWLSGLLGLGMMLWYSWQLALVAIVMSLLPVLLSVAFGGKLTRMESRVSDQNAGFVAAVKDLLSGFPVVKSFQAEAEAEKLYNAETKALEQSKFHRLRTNLLLETISGGAALLMQMSVFLAGAALAVRGVITAGVVIAFVQLSGFVVNAIQQLPNLMAKRKAARGLIEKAAIALQDNTKTDAGRPVPALSDGICCRDVRFGYERDHEILKGVNLKFEPGKSYAIVGASGSGKSTLLNLLLGSYDTYEGSITVGGTELREASANSLYELLSIIQQNVFVFDSTIEENITMFKSFPEEAIADAIRRSGLETLVAQKGRDYRCGENGCNLSGGERQRISIARCLLKNTEVLLMDEATAALDAETAANVTNAILDVEGLTRIIVTHKLEDTVLKRFDRIFVIRGGVVAEQGTFSELLAENGYFSALYNVAKGV